MKKSLVRTLALSCVFCLVSLVSKAQWVTIPDTAFVSYLQATFPACMNGNLMDTTCSGVVNAHGVYCSHRPIRDLTGIQYFDSLQTLNCSYDSITSISFLPKHLISLDCNHNKITGLPILPASVNSVDCGYNLLTNLPTLPLLLKTLKCGDNPISTFPTLPDSLNAFTCDDIYMTSLPVLPANLGYLHCSTCHLTSLPNLPLTLTFLYCTYNDLTSIPALPPNLTTFWCYGNHILSLPALPYGLTSFHCSDNQLTTLPAIPSTVQWFACMGNQLTQIPELPPNLTTFLCFNNPNLTCLPELKQIGNFQFYGTNITCLPNYGNVTTSNPSISTLPLCNQFNNNGCSVYWNINGQVFNDTNSNCIKEVTESNLQNMKVNLFENGSLIQQTYSGGYGIYSFDTDFGNYTTGINTSGTPFDILCPVSGFDTSVITALDSFDYDKDFAMQCKPGFDLGAWSIVDGSGIFFPGKKVTVNIHAGDWAQFWGQNCNTNNLSGQLVTNISGSATFVSRAAGALTPIVGGNTLTYNISNWSAINPNKDFNIIVKTNTTAPLGSQICFDVNVTPTAGDNNVSNNHLSHCFTVVSAYDPNEKEVSPVSSIDAGDWLTYTIHFQNTGTATAEHIYVTDTLDANVDASTFQLLAYSHQPMVQLKENAVRFNFPNINLPDSNANEALSHGYVQYKVKLKNNLSVGTHISNTAFIYFDFNTAVVTNTVSNTISTVTHVAEFGMLNSEFGMNPNPANSFVNISMEEKMIGSNFAITDITGRRMMYVTVVNSAFRIPTSALSNGVYFVTIESEKGRITKKLVVER